MPELAASGFDRPAVVAAAAGIGTAAIVVFAIMPVLVGAMAERFSLDDLQSGLIATAYFSSYALVALSSPLWVRRWNWRFTGLAGFAIMLSALAVAYQADNFSQVQAAITVVGMGAGLLYPVSLTLASDMANTERVYAIKLSVEQLVPAGLLVLMSLGWLIGPELQHMLLAVMAVLLLCLLVSLAVPAAGTAAGQLRGQVGSPWQGVLALVALSVSFAGFAGLWVFLERIGSAQGFEPSFTALWLAVGLITSGVGPLLAAVLADRLGPVRPLVLSIVPALCVIGLLSGQPGKAAYATVLTLLPLCYYFAVSYMMSLIAAVDSNRKMSGLMSFALAVGAASGPALYGAIKELDGPVLTAMGALIATGTVLMVLVARQHNTQSEEVNI
jgi:predicted MFS family arabinose efflux permease